MGQPFITEYRVSKTAEGVEITLRNGSGRVFIAAVVAVTILVSWSWGSALPLLLAIPSPSLLLESHWEFFYSGPSVEHRIVIFGRTIRRTRHALDVADAASLEQIEDSAFSIQRPRWYKLNLWSSVLSKDQTLMRSNDQSTLNRVMTAINEAIAAVRPPPN